MTGIFEIEPLKVRGQFCLLAFKYYSEHYGGVLPQDLLSHIFVNQTINSFRFNDLLYYSCKAYSELTDEPFDYNYKKFSNDCAKINQDQITNLISKLWEAEMLGSTILEIMKKGIEVEAKKKRQPLKKSTARV